MCSQIEDYLIENSRLSYPTIHFRSDLFTGNELNALLNRLKDIAKKHKSQIVDKPEEADHIVYPPSIDEQQHLDVATQRIEYIRVVKKRGKDSILVHRLYTPDSQDYWINNLEIDDDAAGLNDSGNNSSGGDIWEVTANWLIHTDTFNEWMNQEDYEVDAESIMAEGGKVRLKRPPKTLKTIEDVN